MNRNKRMILTVLQEGASDSMKKYILILVLSVITVALGVRAYYVRESIDSLGPEIMFEEENLEYKEGDTDIKLLAGATAWDAIDGDVSDSIIVEKVQIDYETMQAIVYYAVIDHSNNLGRAVRNVNFVPLEDETIAIDKSNETNLEEPKESEVPQVEEEALGIEEADELNNSVLADKSPNILGSNPIIFLTEPTKTIKRNDSINIDDFIAYIIDDKDSNEVLRKNIVREKKYNTNKLGTYDMDIYVVDSDGNKSNVESITLVVE